MRVYSLLEHKGAPAATCAGGALHSVYGTAQYDHVLMPPTADNRATVASFGKEAEALAYLFSVIDRPKALEAALAGKTMQVALRYDQRVELTAVQREALCLIEGANLLDQATLGQWLHLANFWEQWRTST
jgi:hypothetical protein